jgi:hypothetical protein
MKHIDTGYLLSQSKRNREREMRVRPTTPMSIGAFAGEDIAK